MDHALSFTDLGEAVEELRARPELLQRLATIAELPPAPEQADGDVLQPLVDRLHTVRLGRFWMHKSGALWALGYVLSPRKLPCSCASCEC